MDSAFKRIFVVFLLLFLPCSIPTYAASVIPMSFEDMVKQADSVVTARCTAVSSRWKNERIVTDVSLDVMTSIKGEKRSSLLISVLGGVALHPQLKVPVKMHVPGNTSFAVGEEVLLFSNLSNDGERVVLGFNKGKMRIEYDHALEEYVVPVGKKVMTNEVLGEANIFDDWLFDNFLTDDSEANVQVRRIKLSEIVARIKKID
ncbi:MAG: hypothetical protein K6L81_17430 [Agarilytica sp.]